MPASVRWSDEDEEYVATVVGMPSLSWMDPSRELAAVGLCSVLADEVVRLDAEVRQLHATRSEDHLVFVQQHQEIEAKLEAARLAVTALTRRVATAEPEVWRLKDEAERHRSMWEAARSRFSSLRDLEED